MSKTILWLVTAAFAVLTGMAVQQHGAIGILNYQLSNTAGMQVLVDLVIALALFVIWLWQECKRTNSNPWPWIAVTLIAGSFGPLFYFLYRSFKSE